jgi:TRAP-type C4-dicarboxylate transport system permease small subunit
MYKMLLKISDVIAYISIKAAGILLAFVAFIILLQVILRYAFNASLPWPEEAARYSMIWAVMIISNVLIRDRELINVDIFDKLWPQHAIIYRDVFYRVILIILLAVLFREGLLQATSEARQTTTALGISWFWPYLSIPIGAGLMIFQMGLLVIKDFSDFNKKRVLT